MTPRLASLSAANITRRQLTDGLGEIKNSNSVILNWRPLLADSSYFPQKLMSEGGMAALVFLF